VGGEPGDTSASIHGLGYLFSALRREGLIADELVLQLATFLRSLDLFLELTVRTVPRTLTANQVQRGGKQGTDGPELSRIHSSTQHPRDKRRKPRHMALISSASNTQGPDNVPLYAPSGLRCASRRPASGSDVAAGWHLWIAVIRHALADATIADPCGVPSEKSFAKRTPPEGLPFAGTAQGGARGALFAVPPSCG
jgi:hypothetical protein